MDLNATATLGLDAARAADPARYAIAGAVPRLALRPASGDEVAEVLRAASRESMNVVPWGGGTWFPAEPRPGRYDVALDLSALTRVLEYEPADMTITAECGITIAALRAALAARDQELPLEGGLAPRATLGGVLACNASGARRLRLGAPYDRLMGARFALGDGTIARSGGKVVKNVAGYAIHRLLCGSRGGLGVLLEASLKLVPAAESRVALEYDVDLAAIGDAARWSTIPRLEPAGVTVTGDGTGGFAVQVTLEDEARWVGQQVEAVTNVLGTPARRTEGAAVGERLQALADLGSDAGAALELVTAANTPAALAPLLEHEARARFVFHAPAGRLHLFVDPARAQEQVHRLGAHGFALVGARGVDVSPALPPQVALRDLRATIRASLDPARTFALGERWEQRSA